MKGHQKSVLGLQWHRIAENTLASYSQDNTIRVWDVENQKSTMVFSEMAKQPTSMRWSPDGARIVSMEKGG